MYNRRSFLKIKIKIERKQMPNTPGLEARIEAADNLTEDEVNMLKFEVGIQISEEAMSKVEAMSATKYRTLFWEATSKL